MSAEVPPADDGRRPDSPVRRVDAACDRFEAAWRARREPRIEDFLAEAGEADRPALRRELLALDRELRRGHGRPLTPGDGREGSPGPEDPFNGGPAANTGPGRDRTRSGRALADAGRNLLFGLLALQNNFVSRDALLGAFAAWVADRSRPLGRILRDRGALDAGRSALLEALVAEHLKLHGGDTEASLAALSSIGSVRDDLSRIADPDLRDSLGHVSAARRGQDDDPDQTAPRPSVGHSTSAGTRFRILRPHAKGGLGEVFVALDTELNRDVALKEIQGPFADDPRHRARFEFEAEVTGGLEHPGIVPVYGLGHTPDGRPYYAMRFIKGDSLKEATRRFHEAEQQPGRDPGRSTLGLRELLGRFTDVCDAVAYAHSRRVLHRDLKPGNIMLGKYGETLVVDWGLAKALDEPESEGAIERLELPLRPGSGSALEPTLAGSAVGTPAYMSPEQVDGRVDKLGVRSDVYCLGATLYHLLTGHAPCEADERGEIYRKVLAGAIPRPRSLNPRIAPALEAICLKGLALRPGDRYESAAALKADLDRWLADEPVTAWREPLATRARRNRTMVAAALVALVAGVVGLGGVAGVQARYNAKLIDAYDATNRALAETREEKMRAEEALAHSEAVSTFLVEAFRSPDPTQDGRQIKVVDVLDRASERLDRWFEGSQATKGALLNALATTYRGLGLFDQALGLYTKADAVREAALGPDHPDTLTSRHNLARAYRDIGRLSEAIELHEATLKLRERKLGPDHPDTLKSRNNLAIAYQSAGRLTEANTLFEATLKLRERVLGPDHPDTLGSRSNLAGAYRFAGRLSEAIELHEATLKLRERKLGADHPDTLNSRTGLALAYWEAGRASEAIALNEATLKLQEAKLGPGHPDTLATRNNLALAYGSVGRLSEAIALNEATLKLYEARLGPREAALGLDHPDTLKTRRDLASAYQAAGRLSDAIALYRAMLELEAKLGPDQGDMIWTLSGLADAYASLGRWAEAEALLRDTLARRRKMLEPHRPRLAGNLDMLGRILLMQSRWSEAEPLLREALAIQDKVTPDDWSRSDTMSLLGAALLGQGRCAEAKPLIVEGYEGMKAREVRIPAPDRFRLREAAERVVRLYDAWGQPDQATAWKSRLGMPDLPANVFARP